MFNLANYTPWVLFTDLGIILGLLLIGKIIRVKVKLVQKLFIPPSLLAGLLGLIFGPNGLGWLPLSNFISVYPAVLIAVVFGALPLSSPKFKMKEVAGRVGPMWAYSQLGMLIQWSVMGLFGLWVLKWIWPNLHDAFGVMLPTGFMVDMVLLQPSELHLTVLDGMKRCLPRHDYCYCRYNTGHRRRSVLHQDGSSKGHTSYIVDFAELPQELRSGLLPKEKEPSGEITTSPISVDSLTFHLGLVVLAAFGGYMISQGVKMWYLNLSYPSSVVHSLWDWSSRRFLMPQGISIY